MSVPPRRLLTANLATMLATATGKQVGRSRAPGPAPGQKAPAPPYVILYVIPGGGYDGDAEWPEDTARFIYQATSVGKTEEHAEWMADSVRAAMLGRAAGGDFVHALEAPAGYDVMDRSPDGGAGGVEGDGPFSVPERFAVTITPA